MAADGISSVSAAQLSAEAFVAAGSAYGRARLPSLPTYLPAYLPTCLLTYLLTYPPAYLPTCLPTYLLTYVLVAEEFVAAHTAVRAFHRLEGTLLSTYDLGTLLVDPPRYVHVLVHVCACVLHRLEGTLVDPPRSGLYPVPCTLYPGATTTAHAAPSRPRIMYHVPYTLYPVPRSGLDGTCRALASTFDRVIYISCNPISLARDLEVLSTTHTVSRCAAFDQFPYTDHLECGVLLERRAAAPQ